MTDKSKAYESLILDEFIGCSKDIETKMTKTEFDGCVHVSTSFKVGKEFAEINGTDQGDREMCQT